MFVELTKLQHEPAYLITLKVCRLDKTEIIVTRLHEISFGLNSISRS